MIEVSKETGSDVYVMETGAEPQGCGCRTRFTALRHDR
jgi:hypothetical protein